MSIKEGLQKIEDSVVEGYKKIEDGVVGGYKKILNSRKKKYASEIIKLSDSIMNGNR